MPRFFVDLPTAPDAEIVLSGENAAHMERVLRMRTGECFTVCDGRGTDYICTLTRYADKQAYGAIVSIEANRAEPPAPLVLFQGLPKADKMELILQKAVELGATTIVPVATERSVVRLNGKEAAKTDRWRKIVEAAAKQSGRGLIPEVTLPMTLAQSLDMAKPLGCCAAAYEKEESQTLNAFLGTHEQAARQGGFGVFIGPEGGFEAHEIGALAASGIPPVTLGRRILRTETAGLTVLSAVTCLWNW